MFAVYYCTWYGRVQTFRRQRSQESRQPRPPQVNDTFSLTIFKWLSVNRQFAFEFLTSPVKGF